MRSWPSPRGSRNERFVSDGHRLERLGDRFNPIVVKEVRQALKSRQFVVTFLLLLLAAWAGSIFGVSYLGESIDYGSSAVTFYAGFLFALCTATLVIVPFSTFRSIVEERTETTLELLQITALSPVQIVRGKTLSAMVQVLVYYCAIAPFIAFTALLPGFDIVHVTFSLVMLLITALCFSLVALAIGTQARNTTFQSLSSLFVIATAFGGMMTFFGFMTAAGNSIRFDESDTWWCSPWSCSSAFRPDMSASRRPSHSSLSIPITVARASGWPRARSGSFAGSVC